MIYHLAQNQTVLASNPQIPYIQHQLPCQCFNWCIVNFREDEERRKRRSLKTEEEAEGIQEEEDVPSSQFIKRQSIMLVTAKQSGPGMGPSDNRRRRR